MKSTVSFFAATALALLPLTSQAYGPRHSNGKGLLCGVGIAVTPPMVKKCPAHVSRSRSTDHVRRDVNGNLYTSVTREIDTQACVATRLSANYLPVNHAADSSYTVDLGQTQPPVINSDAGSVYQDSGGEDAPVLHGVITYTTFDVDQALAANEVILITALQQQLFESATVNYDSAKKVLTYTIKSSGQTIEQSQEVDLSAGALVKSVSFLPSTTVQDPAGRNVAAQLTCAAAR